MRILEILFVLIISIIVFQHCNTTEPPVNVEKNPREYSWTVDSLSYPESLQTLMKSIWGSSASNVYIVGHCDDIRGQLWHFDGNNWKDYYYPFGVRYSLGVVYGFSANNVWAAGGYDAGTSTLDSAFIMHYDGSSWNRVNTYGGKYIEAIWGSSPNDIWFGGLNGTLFHWNGKSIKRDTLPIYIPFDSDPFYNFPSIYGLPSGDTYFLISAPLPQTHIYLFKYQNNNWIAIDSSVWGYDRRKVWISENDNIYETGSSGFFKWNGSSWDNILGESNIYTVGIQALSENNIFIVGWDFSNPTKGLVYHYNGNDFYLYENLKLDDVTFYDAWWNGTEVFIVGTTHNFPQKTIILHGK